jgi:hypothetical protein
VRRRHRIADQIELKEIEVNGEIVKVILNSDFTFFVYFYGERIEAASMKALDAAIRAASKRDIVVAIEATVMGWGDEATDILVTGRHNGNGNILYRKDKPGEKTEQLHSEDRVCRRLTVAERAEFSDLVKKKNAAEKALNEWPKSKRLNVASAIRGAAAAQRQVQKVKA